MTIAKDFASKAGIAFVALAMIFTMSVPASNAQQTPEDLQKMINDLLAQIEALKGGAASATASGYTWTRDLKTGATGADVMELQKFLNSDPDTRVAATGAGSAGMETSYFGPATAAAVSKFQVKYRADILSPAGLVNPTGFFGPSTRAKANALNTVTTPTPDEDEDGSTDEDEEDEDVTLSGEASLSDTELNDGDDTKIEEGQEDAPVAELELEFEDGDAEVSRIDLSFVDTGSEEDPWDTFSEVSLWVEGEKVASMEVDDEDNWLDEDAGTLRFSDLNIVGMEDEPVTVVIGVTVQSSVDDMPATWNVDALNVRYFDADDVASTDTITEDAVDFEIEEAGSDDEVVVRTSDTDPESTTLQVDEDDKSDYMTVFAFDLDTKDSTNDVEVNEITVNVAGTEDGTTATTTANLINDAKLVIDGEDYDDVTITHGVNGTFVFDIDGDLVIDAGDRVTVEFQAEFKALVASLEGATVQGSITGSSDVESEGADDITASGAATGDEHTLRTEGAILELVSVSETKEANGDSSTTDDEGVFVVKFDVTAFENDLFINKTAASGTTMGTVGVNFLITDGSGNVMGTSSVPEASLSSEAKTEGGQYKVSEGETKTFTLTVNYDPVVSGFFGVQLYSLNFKTTGGDPVTQQLALPAEDYETDPLSI